MSESPFVRRSLGNVPSAIISRSALVGAVSLLAAQAIAGTPDVQFDLPPLVACRDVTTAEFAAANPNERLLETQLEISTLLGLGGSEVQEFLFRISSPGQRALVADYQPKTTLASNYAGSIQVENRRESTKSAGVSVGGVLDLIKVSGSADAGTKNDVAMKYELQVPHETITASGTIYRASGVYFKFRPSRQTTVEGSRTFSLILRVPQQWRGDYLQVHCEAVGFRRAMVTGHQETYLGGARDFFVALYLAGDVDAKSQAERMVRAEAQFRGELRRHRGALVESAKPSVVDQLSAIWRTSSPARPASQQIEMLLFTPTSTARDVPVGLPDSLGESLRTYLAARRELRRLSGGREV